MLIRILSIASFTLLAAISASASTSSITFDNLANGNVYEEGGYVFTGNLTRDTSQSSGPSLRIYGNSALTITRQDGGTFALSGFALLFRLIQDPSWSVTSETGAGFQMGRLGVYMADQFPKNTVENVKQLVIFDPSYYSQNYYIFDDFALSTPSPVPEAPTFILILLGLGLVIFLSGRNRGDAYEGYRGMVDKHRRIMVAGMTANPSFEPTRSGRPVLAFISFWAKTVLPPRAAQLKR